MDIDLPLDVTSYYYKNMTSIQRMIDRMYMHHLKFDLSKEISSHITQDINIGSFVKTKHGTELVRLACRMDSMLTNEIGEYHLI
jgi:hypothetical protein